MTNYRVESSSGRAARKMRLALMGPAFIAAIGYIDPGNFATNIQAGASFGYQLLWVVVWANLMAMLIQIPLCQTRDCHRVKIWRSRFAITIRVP
ncbi:manganese transport protein [Escherichia coli]|uniref:Manganese transport protein n=1 Tax=Escherichia coli TaxID=562 RepID=A0A2X1N5A3_ECOLX|nr:manganese transport protein [Escherichia coli]